MEEPKDPDASIIYQLYTLFASPEQSRALADRFRAGGMGYGDAKKLAFHNMLQRLTVIDINIEELITRYAAIDAYSQGKHPHKPLMLSARNMGKNDLWIAATSSLYDLQLITTDKDFDHLDKEYLALNRVDIKQYRN